DGPSTPPRHLRRRSGPGRRRTWPQRLTLAAGALSTVLLATSAAALVYVYRKADRLPRVELTGVLDTEAAAGEPGNYLIVGVDYAGRLDPDDPVRIGRDDMRRSDTIMVVRIEPGEQRASLLSLP